MSFFEKPVSVKTVYTGTIINVRNDIAELDNGKHVRREVVEHPGGVVIVPVTDEGILMVRQYRYSVGEELLEVPAGKLERGEDPYDCAVRELSEETGCTAGRLVSLGAIYPSPGFSKETLYIYIALDLTKGKAHPDEDEFLSAETVGLDKLIDMIMAGEIKDAKTIAAVMKTKTYLETGK